jgi:hypothetical protein
MPFTIPCERSASRSVTCGAVQGEVSVYHRIGRLLQSSRVSSDLERALFGKWNKGCSFAWLGHGFCWVRSRILLG